MNNLLRNKRSRLRRILMVAVWVPLLVIGLFCATNAFQIYAKNRSADSKTFPAAQMPQSGQSILIVSPHPDDESLGASGLVQCAIRSGVPVHIVFLTDGDAFHFGVSRYYHELKVKPQDYINYGLVREGEARSALSSVGLPSDNITFLGYPDQGLLPIFRQHWSSADPFQSSYSHASEVPYPDAFHPHAVYCGESITSDLASVISQVRPTDIYVTHPNDDHPDHSAAPAYVNLALSKLQSSGASWSANVDVHYFLVHRGDWPVPQGMNENVPLAPPAELVDLDTTWQSLQLTRNQTTRKKAALGRYVSQQEMMGRFLSSFVRPNELFGHEGCFSRNIIPQVSDGTIDVNGNAQDWPAYIRTMDVDPIGDTVLRDFQSSGDLRDFYACADDNRLYVRVDAHSDLSPQLHYNLYLRGFDKDGSTPDHDVEVSFCPRNIGSGARTDLGHGEQAAFVSNNLEISVPLSAFGATPPSVICIEAATQFSRLTVDRTGMRFGTIQKLSSSPVSNSLS